MTSKRRHKGRRNSTRSASRSPSSDSFHSYKNNGPRSDADNHLVYRIGDLVNNRYQILSTVGEGTFGKVVLCCDKEKKNEDADAKIALKIIKRVKKYYRSAKIEIDVLEKIKEKDPDFKHRCVRLINHFDYYGFMCLSFEWLGSSVFDFLEDNFFYPYPLEHVKAISYQLLDALAFLHDLGITHTDLKLENVLFVDSAFETKYNSMFDRDEKVVKKPEIRLIDFGSATFHGDSHSTIVGTRHYRAPEVILELGWDEKCDVWSVGAIMFELYTGTLLFRTHDNMEHLAMMAFVLGDFPANMVDKTSKQKYFHRGKLDWDYEKDTTSNARIKSLCRPLQKCIIRPSSTDHQSLFELMWKLLEYDPEKRISMKHCLNHDFFQSVKSTYST